MKKQGIEWLQEQVKNDSFSEVFKDELKKAKEMKNQTFTDLVQSLKDYTIEPNNILRHDEMKEEIKEKISWILLAFSPITFGIFIVFLYLLFSKDYEIFIIPIYFIYTFIWSRIWKKINGNSWLD